VIFKNIIISLASWSFTKEDFSMLFDDDNNDSLSTWRDKYAVPQVVTIDDGDNKLLIDFKNLFSVNLFLGIIKKRTRCILTEYIQRSQNSLVKDENEN